jgi:hypothetical protein
MSRKTSLDTKRTWLRQYEDGTAEQAIAKKNHRDVRTIMSGIDDARQEREARLAWVDLLKERLRTHQERLLQRLRELESSIQLPALDETPLSWSDVRQWTTWEPSTPPRPNDLTTSLLKQHLKRDKFWGNIDDWNKNYLTHISAKAALQRKMAAVLRRTTRMPVGDMGNTPKPFVYLTSIGRLFYSRILNDAVAANGDPSMERKNARSSTAAMSRDIVVSDEGGAVMCRNMKLAEAPGSEEECRTKILKAFTKMRNLREVVEVVDTYAILKGNYDKVRSAAEETLVAEYVPGRCNICRKFAA